MTNRTTPTLDALHSRIREMILSGEVEAGSTLSQVGLSKQLQVSRTPLREALRMLQQEGLVIAERNRRVRVAKFDVAGLEFLYTQRLLMEPVALIMTVTRSTPAQVADVERTLEQLHELIDIEGAEEQWAEAHTQFHRSLNAGAPKPLQDAIARCQDLTAGARRLYTGEVTTVAGRRQAGMRDHSAIVDAWRERDANTAAEILTMHLARTPLTLFSDFSPGYRPEMLRAALDIVGRGMVS